jgi:hypothetical protein
MRSILGEVQDPTTAAAANATPAVATPASKEIPYDHVTTFALIGRRGNRVQDVVNVSIEGAFVAVAIGYSFIPPGLVVTPPNFTSSGTTDALAALLLAAQAQPTLAATAAQSLLVRLCGIDFKYSIVDSGSGRELQNKPIHNIAGLGESNGSRPFRPLAKPMLFMPRSTIRIEVEEVSEGPLYEGAQLFIVLHGYKILGYGTRL